MKDIVQMETQIEKDIELRTLYAKKCRPNIDYEENHGKRITKSAGYIPLKKQIEILQDAGRRIENLRTGTYDFQDDDNCNFDQDDPTRKLNFDLADASEILKNKDKIVKEHNRRTYLARKKVQMELLTKNELTHKVSIGDSINKDTNRHNPDEGGDKK